MSDQARPESHGRRSANDSATHAIAPLPAPGEADDDSGLSLSELSAAFTRMLGQGDDPYDSGPTPPPAEPLAALRAVADPSFDDGECAVSPRSILEALLFVGHPQNQPLTSEQIAGLMRGVRPAEVDELVRELNAQYRADRRPYRIATASGGYRLTLRDRFARLRDRFYGKTREARLSPAALETLAIVAYNEPVAVERINDLRGKPSGAVLRQLVRRELVRIERGAEAPRAQRYRVTKRFLRLFGLASLDDLPRGRDVDRR